MKIIQFPADQRGKADFGWLNSRHTFSFGRYYRPDRMGFGVLRVINDDIVSPARGFDTHSHDNMEIISIPLEGDLEHKDSMGHVAVIRQGDIQVMSAGTGIAHSEYNKNDDRPVGFLQIWVKPERQNVPPRYDQYTMDESGLQNQFKQVLSPESEADTEGVWIHQQAWFHLGKFTKGQSMTHPLHSKENGLYVFVLEGEAKVGENQLHRRDGIGVYEAEQVEIHPSSGSYILLMEVPMS